MGFAENKDCFSIPNRRKVAICGFTEQEKLSNRMISISHQLSEAVVCGASETFEDVDLDLVRKLEEREMSG